MESKLHEIEAILEKVKSEVDIIKEKIKADVDNHDGSAIQSISSIEKIKSKEESNTTEEASNAEKGYTTETAETGNNDLLKRIEKLEGTAGVEKIMITDIGERIQVIVQTPLGSVLAPLHHTTNTSKAAKAMVDSNMGSGTYVAAPTVTGAMKGAPSAGMTPEQLQDFKKQTLQITQLQAKIKELEGKLSDANNMIKKGDDQTVDLLKREVEDVKEIYLYLDNINVTMSEKIANQRVEMEKIAGDTPQPVNYDPFNYGEAYSGDIVDFEARKRIVELRLLLQSLQTAMNSLKESVRISPEIDLGYKVVRLDQLLEVTGFSQAVKNGDVTNDNGLLLSQASDIEPPEKRYPKLESFQTGNENKESTWAMTDSIMQTMYRLEVELGQLQKTVEGMEGGTGIYTMKDVEAVEASKLKVEKISKQETNMEHDDQTHTKLSFKNSSFAGSLCQEDTRTTQNIQHLVQNSATFEKNITSLSEVVKKMEHKIALLQKGSRESRRSEGRKSKLDEHKHRHTVKIQRFPEVLTSDNKPVRLRHLLQRFFSYQVPHSQFDVYRLPKLVGRGYQQHWPENHFKKPEMHQKYKEKLGALLEPVCDEYMIKGNDGHYYRGDKATPKILTL